MADHFGHLGDEMVALQEDRHRLMGSLKQGAAGVKADVGELVARFEQETAELRAELAELKTETRNILASADRLLTGMREESDQRRAALADMMSKARRQLSDQTRDLLGEAQRLFAEIQKESAERRASWQELLRRLGGVRQGKRAAVPAAKAPAQAEPDAPPNEAKKPQTGQAKKKPSRRKRTG